MPHLRPRRRRGRGDAGAEAVAGWTIRRRASSSRLVCVSGAFAIPAELAESASGGTSQRTCTRRVGCVRKSDVVDVTRMWFGIEYMVLGTCWSKGRRGGRVTARAYRARRGRTRSHAGHSARTCRWPAGEAACRARSEAAMKAAWRLQRAACRPARSPGAASRISVTSLAPQCCFATRVLSPLMSRYGSRRLKVL